MALFNVSLPLTHFVLCSITIGSCSIWHTNPYPLTFFDMHPMTISCPTAEIKNVVTVAMGRPIFSLEAKYTWRRRNE